MKKLCTALLCGVLTGALPVVSIPDGYSAETQKRETELKTLLRNPGSKEEFTRKLKRLMELQPDEEARLQLLSGQRTYLSPVFQNYLQFAFYELSRTEPEKPLYRLLHLSLIQENGETEDPYLYTLRIADLPSTTLLRTAGIVLMRKNLGKKAGEFLEEAYRREPTAVNLQTLALYEHQILQTDRALRRIREAEKRFSSDRDLLILGELLLTLNQPDEALRVLRKSRKQTEDTRKLQAIALFLLHREKEGFELMDRNGLLEMSELTKTTFQSTFLIQLNSLQRRRNNRMVQKFFHSALSVFMPLPILPIPEEFSPLRNLLFRPGFFPAGILEYYQKSSPEEQKRIVETLRKNHWPAPELFLEPERKEQNLERIRKKLENGIPETGELVFYLQNLRVNDLSIPEMERILKAQEQRKLFHPQVLRRYCTMQAVPLERRRKILDSLLKFAGADYVNFTIFPSELQPVITRNMKNILKTMSADEKERSLWMLYSYCNTFSKRRDYDTMFREYAQFCADFPERDGFYSDGNLLHSSYSPPCSTATILNLLESRGRQLPRALAGIGDFEVLQRVFRQQGRGEKPDPNAIWSAVIRQDLPALLKIWLAFQCGRQKEAGELLAKLDSSLDRKSSAELLNLAAFHLYLSNGKDVERIARHLLGRTAAPVLHRQFAAVLLLKLAMQKKKLEDPGIADDLLSTLPGGREKLIQILEPLLSKQQLAAFRAKYPEQPPFPGSTYLNQSFAGHFQKNRKEAIRCLKECLENAIPIFLARGYVPPALQWFGNPQAREALEQAVRELKQENSDPLLIAVLYDFLLKNPAEAEKFYAEILKRDPHSRIASAKLCALRKSADPALLKNLKEAPVAFWKLAIPAQDREGALRVVEYFFRNLPDLTVNQYYFLTGTLKSNAPQPPPPALQKRIDALLLEMLESGLKNPDLANNARFEALCFSMEHSEPLPESLRKRLIEQYTPQENMFSRIPYHRFFLQEYRRDPGTMRPLLRKLGFGKQMEEWDRLAACPEKEFAKELAELRKKDEKEKDLRTVELLWIAGERKITLNLFELLSLYESGFSSLLLQDLKRYLRSLDPEILMQELLRAGRELRKQNPEIVDSYGNFRGNVSYVHHDLRNFLTKYSLKDSKFRRALLRACATEPENVLHRPYLMFEEENLLEVFSGTPVFGTMADFRILPECTPFERLLTQRTRQNLLKQLQTLPENRRTFGMDIAIYLLPTTRHVEDLAKILIRRKQEWSTLSEARKQEILSYLLDLSSNLLTESSFSAAPELGIRKRIEAIENQRIRKFLDRKSLRHSMAWNEMNSVFRSVERIQSSNPVLAERLLRHMKQLADNDGIGVTLENCSAQYFLRSLKMARLLHKCGYRCPPNIRLSSPERLAVNDLRGEKNPDLFALLNELQEIYPAGKLNERQTFLILWHTRKFSTGAPAEQFRAARKKDPKNPVWKTGLLFTEARELGRQGKALPETMKKELIRLVRPIAARLNIDDLRKEFPGVFDDPKFRTVLYSAKVRALNRRTRNNPEQAPDEYLHLLREGLGFKGKIPKEEFRKLVSPLAVNSLETFPVLTVKDAQKILPFLLEYAQYVGDKTNLEILKEYTDLVTPEYRRRVRSGKEFPPDAVAALEAAFPESAKQEKP